MKISTYKLGVFATNCYLVQDEKSKKAALIDPAEYSLKIMKDISKDELSLEYIILTHGHFDHIVGANRFKAETGAKVVSHALENEYLQDSSKSHAPAGSEITADIFLKENDVISFGDISLKAIHTPGHTKGSCCFLCEDEKIMFSGDTFFKRNVGRCDLYGGDYKALQASLRKLKTIQDNYKVYPGHGNATNLDDEIVENPHFRV